MQATVKTGKPALLVGLILCGTDYTTLAVPNYRFLSDTALFRFYWLITSLICYREEEVSANKSLFSDIGHFDFLCESKP